MRTIFASAILTYFFTIALHAQPGFNQWYDFDSGASFHNILLKEDTLIIAGTAYDTSANQWGALFLKMDTLGNIMDHSLYLDELGGQLAFNDRYPIVLSSDNQYILAGDIFDRNGDFLLWLDDQGNMVKFLEYPYPSTILFSAPFSILEMDNSFFLFSRKQTNTYKIKVAITKLDHQGNVLWEKFYAHPHNDEAGLISVYPQDDNTFVIGAAFGDNSFPDHTDRWAKTWIFAVDSLGNMLWDWESEQQEQENGAWGLQQLENGDWMYATRVYNTVGNLDFYYTPKIVRRDSNFDLIWEYVLTSSQADANEVANLIPSPDGQWIGTGSWAKPDNYYIFADPPIENAYLAGCIYKLSDSGDSLWTQCDTITVNGRVSRSEISNMVVLPSGSTIAVGRGSINTDTTWRSVGWVIKRDKHGCMEDLCVLTGVEELEESVPDPISVYPNPASSLVTFDWTGSVNKEGSLLILDAMGQQVQEVKLNENKYRWDVSLLPKGIYFYQYSIRGMPVDTGRIIIQ
jgi:hypothetical protein